MRRTRRALGLLLCILISISSALPTAQAQLAVSTDRSSYQRGQVVTVTVSGGTGDGVVMIQFEDPSDVVVWADQGLFDSGGGFQYQLRIPSGWDYGTYTVRIKDLETGEVEARAFGVSPPPVLPPSPPPPENKPPVADAGPDHRALANRTLFLDGSGSHDPDGGIESYGWSFGDGASAAGVNVTHVYASPGVYNVTLTVEDDEGAMDSDGCVVSVEAPPTSPVAGVDEGVPADAVNHVVDALEETNATVMLNTTGPVTVSILRYPGNPYPDAPLPGDVIPVYVDVHVSRPDSVAWPIYVERWYTDGEAEGLNESRLAIYYYKEGEWRRCRESGAYPERNIVWAWMHRDEAVGSVILVGETPSAAAFELYDLEVEPAVVEPGEAVNVTVAVSNVGGEEGSHTVELRVDGVAVDSETVTLDAGASTVVGLTASSTEEGVHAVEVDGEEGSFLVSAPPSRPFPWPVLTVATVIALIVIYLIWTQTDWITSLTG